jgi:hypothetical protein
MRGENPIEPIEKIDLLRRYRPALIVEAATRDPEQRALPVTDSPAFGAIIARLSADGRWRAARQENPVRPATGCE